MIGKIFTAIQNSSDYNAPFGSILNVGQHEEITVINNPNSDKWFVSFGNDEIALGYVIV